MIDCCCHVKNAKQCYSERYALDQLGDLDIDDRCDCACHDELEEEDAA